MESDSKIEAFRLSLERVSALQGQLQSLGIAIARADELAGLISRAPDPSDRKILLEEQSATGHSLTLRIRQSRLESDFRRVWPLACAEKLAALDAAAQLVTVAAGGRDAAPGFRTCGGTSPSLSGIVSVHPPHPRRYPDWHTWRPPGL
jgi:hypothetical protein